MKFYKFKNMTSNGADLYLYGNIESEKVEGWSSKSDVDLEEFKQALDGVYGTLNIYINSGGGSVFAASAMTSLLQRAKTKGVKINAYIDGLCASAATFIAMAADEINVYKNSILMVHKPMGGVFGNATEMKKMIDTLNVIEESMLNLYEAKAKCDRDKIKSMVDKETWLDASKINDTFNVNMIDSEKKVAACVDFKNCGYTIPDEIKAKLTIEEPEEAPQEEPQENTKEESKEDIIVDYSDFEKIIKSIKE